MAQLQHVEALLHDNWEKPMQHQKASPIAAHIVVLLYEGVVAGCNSKSKTAKSTQKLVPLLPLPWLNALLLGNRIRYGQLLNAATR